MSVHEPARRYTQVAVALHWTITVLVLAQIVAGVWMTRGDSVTAAAPGTLRFEVFQLHKSVGFVVLLLSVARLAWRLFNPPPSMPESVKAWEKTAAQAVHWSFYALMIALPLTGWALVSSSPTGIPTRLFGLVEWPHLPLPANGDVSDSFSAAHATLAWIAVALIVLHVGGALKHQLFDRVALLARIAPSVFGGAAAPETSARGLPVTIAAPLALVFVVFAADAIAASGTRAPALDADVAGSGEPAASEDGAWSWRVDPDVSAIAFEGVRSGVAFMGQFDAWSAEIRFDPGDLAGARIAALIDVGSATTADSYVADSILSPSWLDASNFPEARFEATGVRSTGEGAYEAEGTLTLKGITQPLVLPFTLELDGDMARAEGTVALDRRAFEVGTNDAGNDATVSGTITVTVTVEATRAAADE